MNDIDTTNLEQGDDAQPQGRSLHKRAYEAPRVVTDDVFVTLSCTGPPDNTFFAGCPCPGE